jgi:hypothetical protein
LSTWLQDFEFGIQLDVWTFAMAIGCSFLIAALTICYQVIGAALINPAISFKAE